MENEKRKVDNRRRFGNEYNKKEAEKRTTKKISTNIYAGFLVLIFSVFHFPLSVLPHRFHTSLTRIDYNAEDKNIEITIQLFTHDLEKVLERISKQRIDFEKSAETDKLIEKYLEEHFVLQNQKGEKLKLRWVGKESDVDTTLVYMEFQTADNIEGFMLRNTIFFESFRDQTNLITARFDGKKADLLFKAGDKFKVITAGKT
jgi:hypothetical protein